MAEFRWHSFRSGPIGPLASLAFVALLVGVGGCDGETAPDLSAADGGSITAVDEVGDLSTTGLDSLGNAAGPGVGWPNVIPSDIPALRSGISSVLGGPGMVRIFYSGVTDDEFMAYLEALDEAGFELEYLVYASDANPERAEERAAAGEWDAVRARRGDFTVGVAFGAGEGSIDVSGPIEDVGSDRSWPSEWAAIPTPDELVITEVQRFSSGPIVNLAYSDDTDIEGYIDELTSGGFTVTDRSFDQEDRIISVTVRDQTNEVQVRSLGFGRLEITVSPAGDTPTMPVASREFPEYLPEVPGGKIQVAVVDPQGGFSAVVTIEEGHTTEDYLAVLSAAGWEETGETMLAGFILTDGEHRLTIFDSPSGFAPIQISIQVDP